MKPRCEPFSSPSIRCTTVANDSVSGDCESPSRYFLRTDSQSLLPRRASYQLSRIVRQHSSKAAACFFVRSTSCTALKRYDVPGVGLSPLEGAVTRPRRDGGRRLVIFTVVPVVGAAKAVLGKRAGLLADSNTIWLPCRSHLAWVPVALASCFGVSSS